MQIYPKQDMARMKFEVCEKTNLVDYAISIWQQLHGTNDIPQGRIPSTNN
jgi:hypothetical protein